MEIGSDAGYVPGACRVWVSKPESLANFGESFYVRPACAPDPRVTLSPAAAGAAQGSVIRLVYTDAEACVEAGSKLDKWVGAYALPSAAVDSCGDSGIQQ